MSEFDKSVEATMRPTTGGAAGSDVVKKSQLNVSGALHEMEDSWDYSVPADELFVRCPVSKNLFAQRWDDEEGEMLYVNAVKIFVTASADAAIFKLGKETDQANPGMRYLIVDKAMVLNPWLENGKASSVRNAIERYETMVQGRPSGTESPYSKFLEALRTVAANEDEEHTFVMLELNA